MLFIQIADHIHLPVTEVRIQQAVEVTLQVAAVSPETEITIVFTDDQQLHQLNLQYLGIDAPTDVLSFPAGFNDPDTDHPYLGDVLISIPRAEAQASENHQTPQEELILLVVHGVLHLIGYDHANAEEQDRMWTAQSKILSRLKA